MNFDKFYKSSSYYGSDKIIKKYLDLKINKKFPIVIPHGIDYHQHEHYLLDTNSIEPVYLCLRDDVYKRVNSTKDLQLNFLTHGFFI